MSKRAGAVAEDTRERILTAARSEFAERGFQGSSLRRICAGAGVTTGALYFFFEGKDDLFQTVISQATEPFTRLMNQHYEGERAASDRHMEEGAQADMEISRLLIDLYFSNRQTWDILLHHLNHPYVQAFLDQFVETSTEHYQFLMSEAEKAIGKQPPDRFAIHQFVHMQVDAMLTLISHEFRREEMLCHSETVVRMLRGAFRALILDEE